MERCFASKSQKKQLKSMCYRYVNNIACQLIFARSLKSRLQERTLVEREEGGRVRRGEKKMAQT